MPGVSLKGRSFGRINLKILYRLIDDFLVEGRVWGLIFSERNIDIVWRTYLLPGTSIGNLMLVPVFLLMPFRFRKSVLAWLAGKNHSIFSVIPAPPRCNLRVLALK